MEFGIGTIFAGIWTAIGIPALAYGFRWLSSTINRNKAMEGSLLDDQVIVALRTAISNIGNKTVDAIRKNPGNWKDAAKGAARDEAKDQALLLLGEKARQHFHDIGDAGLDILIRKLVDDRAKK